MKIKFLLLLILPLFLVQCSKDDLKPTEEKEILEIKFDPATALEYENYENQRSTFGSRETFFTVNAAIACMQIRDGLFVGNNTLYAPTDRAFRKMGLTPTNICELDPGRLLQILTYHVSNTRTSIRDKGCLEMSDGNISHLYSKNGNRINDSRILFGFTLRGQSGSLRIYAITEVLPVPDKNIVQTARESNIFNRLLAAVAASDPAILSALSDESAILTVFAPTDNAFAALFETLQVENLDALIETLGIDRVSQVLLYHVVDNCAFSNDLVNGQTLTTLQGETIEVDLGALEIIDASRTGSDLMPNLLDIRTSNGIVHGIKKVLLPSVVL